MCCLDYKKNQSTEIIINNLNIIITYFKLVAYLTLPKISQYIPYMDSVYDALAGMFPHVILTLCKWQKYDVYSGGLKGSSSSEMSGRELRTQTIVYSTLKLQWFQKLIYWSIIKTFGVRGHPLRQPKLLLAQMPPYGIQNTKNTILNYNIKHI